MSPDSRISSQETALQWTGILKALADESRLQIIHELLSREASVRELAANLDIKVYNISKHLKILESAGLVCKRKDGALRIYKITDEFRSKFRGNDNVLDLGCCKFIFDSKAK
jgi:DNA-binding transcriptional ArsR family regulator